VTDESDAVIVPTYRKTTRSKRTYIETWKGAKIVVNGKALSWPPMAHIR